MLFLITKKMFARLLLIFNLILSFVSILAFISCYISPATFWWAAFLALFTPIALVLNFAFFVLWIFVDRMKVIVSLLTIVVGFPHIMSSFSVSRSKETRADDISVTSYNVRVYNCYSHLRDSDYRSSKGLVGWLSQNHSDILCIQESYNLDSSRVFNSVNHIKSGGFKYFYSETELTNRIGAQFGMVIYSRYPMVKKGVIDFQKSKFNKAIYSDIKVNSDTIRVYNVHLQSIFLNEDDLFGEGTGRKKYRGVARSMKAGYINRSYQVDTLVKHIESCKYPVIVAGDFNDTPYSYTYRKINSLLSNSFESKGNGFGFTYNGKMFFLRIDHQFFTDEFELIDFETHSEIGYSDHFPIRGTYRLK